MMRNLILLTGLFCVPTILFAETVTLKSGKVIEGEIKQFTDDGIRIDVGVGVPVSYFRDEIATIDGKQIDPNPVGGWNKEGEAAFDFFLVRERNIMIPEN